MNTDSKELKILNSFSPNESWESIKTKEGKSKESYIAESEKRRVFLKYDVNDSTLEVLSSLGIAPKLLHAGKENGRRFVIQRFVDGPHPNKVWCVKNLSSIGKFFQKLHSEKTLVKKLRRPNENNTSEHITKELEKRRKWILGDIDKKDQPNFIQNLDLLVKTSGKLEESSLVVVHADPNLTNFMLTKDSFYMIDWDDILLSDEMKDISKFLVHSFVPKNKWRIFFDSYGIEFNKNEQIRFYWWLASGELNIAYWAATAGYKERVPKYMKQFKDAYGQLDNLL